MQFLAGAAAISCAAAILRAGEKPEPPLPDPRPFLDKVRQNIRSDRALLEQYTFTETFTERRLDSRGAVKKAKTETYEVYPSLERGRMYRRLVARDGRPLPEKELADQDRKQEEKTEKRARRLAEEDSAARQKRLARQEESRAREQAVVDELFQMDEILIEGREDIDGRAAVIVSFAPRPGFEPVTRGGKFLQKISGRAWIDEEDKQLVRLETRLLESFGVGPARVVRLQKGASGYFQRRKVNGEIWLPAEARFTGTAKVLLLFGSRVDILSQYADYKKFSVGTEEQITGSGLHFSVSGRPRPEADSG